jgi:hypothetical protein
MRAAELWSGCVAGALEKAEHEALLRSVGFEEVSVEVTHTYEAKLASFGCCGGSRVSKALVEAPLASAFVRARKPVE